MQLTTSIGKFGHSWSSYSRFLHESLNQFARTDGPMFRDTRQRPEHP